jgi:hypothetical protein
MIRHSLLALLLIALPLAPTAAGPATPTPVPTTAPGAWGVTSTAVRVEGTDVIVSGTVENKSRPLAAFAEVRVFNAAGQRVAEGNSPLQPNPVPSGGAATFEVRMSISDVVRRYVVTIRPVSAPTTVLVEHRADVKDVKIFGAIVAKAVKATVQARTPNPTRGEFIIDVANTSTFPLASATVRAEVSVTCRFTAQTPPRFAQEVWSGSVTVTGLAPGASQQLPLTLTGGLCEGVVVQWSATTTTSEVKIGD